MTTCALAYRGLRQGIGVAALFLLAAAPAPAGERSYVLPDGRTVGLTRSNTEFGVTLRAGHDAKAVARRLEDAGQGTLEAFPNADDAPVRLLRLDKADVRNRQKVRQMPGVADVRPVYRFETSTAPVVSTGEVVLKLQRGLSDARRAAIWREYQVGVANPEPGLPDVYRLGPFDADFDEVAFATRLAGDPRIIWANPNFRRSIEFRQITPSDQFFSFQWYLNNTGQGGGAPGADIDAVEAWVLGQGEDVLFGIFDDSCDVDHEDLRGNYTGTGNDVSLQSNDPGFNDPRPKQIGDSHGTQVVGLAVAASNDVGGRGVAPLSRFTCSRGLSNLVTDAQLASAFTFARQQEVDVHINSWGLPGQPNPPVLVDAIRLAFEEGRNRGDVDDDEEDDVFNMVIVFAAGNDGDQNVPGFELSTLPEVIAVGASDDFDFRAPFSNFGTTLDILAPGEGFGTRIFTTDNTDGEYPEDGANVGGTHARLGIPDVDSAGRYTEFFGGTSAACPIVAGVAGLILSVNPLLTATDVRVIIEHTADPIAPDDADYHGITSRSLRYGYGRVNAGGAGDKLGAVEAAQQSITNGGRTWPDRPADVQIANSEIRWQQAPGTNEFLVVESESEFAFVPEDGECYHEDQIGCGTAQLAPLPDEVSILAVGCELVCGSDDVSGCETGAEQCVSFLQPGGTKQFGVYARNTLGRYSWGVAGDSSGTVIDSGVLTGGAEGGSGGGGGGNGGGEVPDMGPAVTISVSPLRGKSPLVVNFAGNAISEQPIDDSRTAWDFDVDDGDEVDARTRTATFTYVVGEGVVRTFVARFTMFDTDGNSGSAEVAITVEGAEVLDGGGEPGDDEVRIIVGLPGTPGSDVDSGTAPFATLLSIDASGLPGVLQSVSWDLGDGTQASTLVVPHTFQNTNDEPIRIPITATVTSVTQANSVVTTTITRFITVNPGTDAGPVEPPDLPGTGADGPGGRASPCGVIGMIPLAFCFVSLLVIRRRAIR